MESNIVSGVSEDGGESNTNNENKAIIELLMSACDGDVVTLESITRSNPQIVNQLFPSDEMVQQHWYMLSVLIILILSNPY